MMHRPHAWSTWLLPLCVAVLASCTSDSGDATTAAGATSGGSGGTGGAAIATGASGGTVYQPMSGAGGTLAAGTGAAVSGGLGGAPLDATGGASSAGASGHAGSGTTGGAGSGGLVMGGGTGGATGGASGEAGSGGPIAGGGTSGAGGTATSGAGSGGLATGGAAGAAASGGGETATGGVGGDPRPTVTAAPGTDLVRVDAGVRHQTFEGWGTSLCWWANHVGGWSQSARNAVVEAVVDPVEGLGYNIFRYNIGGGENPSHDHMEQYRDMPGFQSSDGTWTWDADANQRAILLSIAERGTDLIFEAFSNSPPYWMTNSGCASGSNDGSNNLREDSYEAFADYLTEVVRYYRDEYGITFRTLEPMNEPSANWWTANGSQEGCHFDPPDQERIIQAVAQQLADKGLTGTTVSASDENSMDDALRNISAFSDTTLAAMSQINVHSYAGSRRSELRMLATSLGKRLWQSESGPLGQNISDDTEAALFMAGRIIEDLRELKPEAWIDWQSGDPSRSWASFTLNDTQQTHSPLKRFYMHAGFSRYIRPGAVFVDVNHPDMVAALSGDGQSLTLVVRNGDTNATHGYTFDLTSLPAVGPTTQAYRTSRTENLDALAPIAVEGYSFVATVPAYSITTFVVLIP
jgi:O-glycosyl hydrolase